MHFNQIPEEIKTEILNKFKEVGERWEKLNKTYYREEYGITNYQVRRIVLTHVALIDDDGKPIQEAINTHGVRLMLEVTRGKPSQKYAPSYMKAVQMCIDYRDPKVKGKKEDSTAEDAADTFGE